MIRALNGALTAWCKDANAERNKRKDKEFVRDKIVQRRQKRADGFEVVDVERGQTKNHYTPDFGAKVTAGAVVVDNGWADQDNLQERFAFHKNILSGAAVGKALIAFLVDNGAIALRDGGGVYWIPREAIDGWVALAEALEACPLKDNGNRVQMLHVVMDEHADQGDQGGVHRGDRGRGPAAGQRDRHRHAGRRGPTEPQGAGRRPARQDCQDRAGNRPGIGAAARHGHDHRAGRRNGRSASGWRVTANSQGDTPRRCPAHGRTLGSIGMCFLTPLSPRS